MQAVSAVGRADFLERRVEGEALTTWVVSPSATNRECVLRALKIQLLPAATPLRTWDGSGQDMGQITRVQDARAVLHANAYRDGLWFGTHNPLDRPTRRVHRRRHPHAGCPPARGPSKRFSPGRS